MKTASGPKYHDGTPAQVGDTITTGTFGTCKVISLDVCTAFVRNVCTGEEWEIETHESDLVERPKPTPVLLQRTENGYTALQFVSYLRNQLIPDFRAADMHATTTDFETALQFICGLADERERLIAALSALVETFHREAPACSPGYTYEARQLLSDLAP